MKYVKISEGPWKVTEAAVSQNDVPEWAGKAEYAIGRNEAYIPRVGPVPWNSYLMKISPDMFMFCPKEWLEENMIEIDEKQ
jgi:hypothetical protein